MALLEVKNKKYFIRKKLVLYCFASIEDRDLTLYR